MRRRRNLQRETLDLWYALGRLYARAAGAPGRSARLGFTVTLVSGALVLLSAPLFGTSWAGPFAPAIPALLGLASGFGALLRERLAMRRGERDLRRTLQERGLDATRPAKEDLSAYYDAQLILLRSEYEYLLESGAKRSHRLLEESFGFTPEDPFESGPLNVRPDTQEMVRLRERWERRISMRREREANFPRMGFREDRAYRVFPREMTVPAETATREAYLTISRSLLKKRYGRKPGASLPEALRERAGRDLREYEEIVRRTSPPTRP